jgi:hypothetical protein
MSEAFRRTPDLTPYTAILPGVLCNAPVDTDYLLGPENGCGDAEIAKTFGLRPLNNNAWGAKAMKDFDFEEVDHLSDPEAFNRTLWLGIRGAGVPYPVVRHGRDLRRNRKAMLEQWRKTTGSWVTASAGNSAIHVMDRAQSTPVN